MIEKLNRKYPGASFVCFAIIGNKLVTTGSPEMNATFCVNREVQHHYKQAVLQQNFHTDACDNGPSTSSVNPTLKDMLQTHVFDMNMDMMRAIIASAAGPPESLTNKSGRRNWYRVENTPVWWQRTELPFHSVNQPSAAGGKKLTTVPLMKLVESLQLHLGVIPTPPANKNKTGYVSCFQIEETDGVLMQPNTSSGEVDSVLPVAAEHDEEIGVTETVESASTEIPSPIVSVAAEHEEDTGTEQETRAVLLKRQEIEILTGSDISYEEKALKAMKLISSWEDLWALSDSLKNMQPIIPKQLAREWQMPKLLDVDKRFKEFIPLTIGERTILQASPNGNCIFNAVSLALFGNECMSQSLRLASVVQMTDDLVPFAKYILGEFREQTQFWLSAAANHPTYGVEMTTEELELLLRQELVETLKFPFKAGSILHLHLLCHLLSRPIQQHCFKGDNFQIYKQLIHPPLQDVLNPAPIHLVWVPTSPKSKYATINHVVPAVCHPGPYGTHEEECAFSGLSVCSLTYGFNSHLTKPHWVECCMCNQWIHTVCLGISEHEYRNKEFPCGCDILRNGKCPIKSLDFYETLTLENVPGDIDLKSIAENLPDSLRNSLFRTKGYQRLKWDLRTRLGPFSEEFIHSVNMKLKDYISDDDITMIPDIYLPEVLLRIIMRQEGVNKLLAEMVLMSNGH